MKLIKSIHGHKRNCRAVYHVKTGDWDSVWCCPTFEWTGRGSSNCVILFSCNDTDCNAVLRVKESWILEKLPKT